MAPSCCPGKFGWGEAEGGARAGGGVLGGGWKGEGESPGGGGGGAGRQLSGEVCLKVRVVCVAVSQIGNVQYCSRLQGGFQEQGMARLCCVSSLTSPSPLVVLQC
jgi:hypothetical protein